MIFRGLKSLKNGFNTNNILISTNQSFKRFNITPITTSSLFRNFTTNIEPKIESSTVNTTTTNIPLSQSQTENIPITPKKTFQPVKLDGKLLASHIKKSIKADTEDFIKNSGVTPNLVVIYVGDSKQIESYIKAKRTGCEDVGFKFTLDRFSSDIKEDQLIKKIKYHSEDPSVHGIIVQLPLPDNLNKDAIIQSIDPKKDVDGLTSTNLGQIMISKKPLYIPCTPLGILEILKAYKIKVEGKNVVVLGRSNLVGRTIATILSQKDLTNPSIMNGANVTIIHKYSKNHLGSIRQADLIISATGVPGLIKKEDLKRGVILIDVGISFKEDSTKKSGYKMVGDIDPEAYSRSIAYTPVPGGVGPLTVACLLRNVLRSAILQYRIQSARVGSALNNKFTEKNNNNNNNVNNNNNNNNNNQEPHHNEDLKPFFSRNRLKTLNQTPYLLFESRSISIYTIAGIQQCMTIPQHPLNNAKTLWSKVSLGNPLVLKTSDHHGGSSGGNFQHPNINQFQIDSNIFQQCPIFKLNNNIININNNNDLSNSFGRVLLSTNSSYNEYSKVIQCGGHFINSTLVSMGNPHCVLHLENVDEFPMDYYGKVIESHPIFPQKTNVEFVQVKTRDSLRVRVWQRGIGVTNSCGTGAAAALVSGVLRGKNNRKANVQMDGGILEVEWREEDDKVFVSCPSVTVFEGSIKFFQDELQQPF